MQRAPENENFARLRVIGVGGGGIPVIEEFPQFPVTRTYDELRSEFQGAIEARE